MQLACCQTVGAVDVVTSDAEGALVNRERVERTEVVSIHGLIEKEDQRSKFSIKSAIEERDCHQSAHLNFC